MAGKAGLKSRNRAASFKPGCLLLSSAVALVLSLSAIFYVFLSYPSTITPDTARYLSRLDQAGEKGEIRKIGEKLARWKDFSDSCAGLYMKLLLAFSLAMAGLSLVNLALAFHWKAIAQKPPENPGP